MATRASAGAQTMKTELDVCLGQASQFALSREQALVVVRELVQAVLQWRAVGQSADVGMTTQELNEFAPAFEHSSLVEAKKLVGV